jgi:hypothetical protein
MNMTYVNHGRLSTCDGVRGRFRALGVALAAVGLALSGALPAAWAQSAEPAKGITVASVPLSAIPSTAPLSFDQIGALAGQQYAGDGLAIVATAEGARLRSVFQKLEAEATREGLWISSTAEEGGRMRLIASAVCRDDTATPLAATGSVSVAEKVVSFTRPGLTEEYATSVDGVRQDFVITERPAGTGELRVELALSGARAEQAAAGARLTLRDSGRALAYSRLRVIDATGRELAASLEVIDAGRLAARVADAEASYPVRIDPTFSDANWVSLNPGNEGLNDAVFAIVADGGGNIYVGGAFTYTGSVAANRIAKWNGSSWSALGTGMNNTVYALAVSGSDLYAGGHFTTAGGVANTSHIAKWNGSAWSALGTGMDYSVYALAVSGADLYAGGDFITTKDGLTTLNRIGKWDGGQWLALGTGVSSPSGYVAVFALAVSGTDLYAGGSFTRASGVAANNIAKWTGGAWSALSLGLNNQVYALAVSGGVLYAGGSFTLAGMGPACGLATWNGFYWDWFGPILCGTVRALAVSGGALYAGGDNITAGGIAGLHFAKLAGGMVETSPRMNDTVYALAVSGGDLYAGGTFTMVDTLPANHVAKSDNGGWSVLSDGMNNFVHALAVIGSDLYAGGTFTKAGGVTLNHIAKWNGSVWSALGTGMDGGVYALAVSGTDLYAGGDFITTADGLTTLNRIAKWNGSAWSALSMGMHSTVLALAVSGSDLYAGGDFITTADGLTTLNRIAKWNGSAWSALGPGLGAAVRALAVSGTDLYVGGYFTNLAGAMPMPVSCIAKWNGSAWSPLGSGVSLMPHHAVLALAVSGTDLYVGGVFDSAGGVPNTDNIARWSIAANSWFALGGAMNSLNSPVHALAMSGTDLYAGGDFTAKMGGGVPLNYIAKWNGSAWSALGTGMNGPVYALAADAYGHLFVGGLFGLAGTTVSPFIAQANISHPGCSGDVVVLQNMTFTTGNTYICTATTSITAGTGVTVQNGATVNFRAPIINLQPGFKVENGAVFSAKQ